MKINWFSWAEALRSQDFAAIADWFSFRFFLIGGLGVALSGLAACAEKSSLAFGLRALVMSLFFGAACTVSGWMLGLLFGVPRSLSRPQAGPAPANAEGQSTGSQSSRVNTNLEDISDWLTKTIVGVGLTQLFAAPHYIWSAAGKLNDFGLAWTPYGQVLILTLFFYFVPGGFWIGYVGTRTILTKLFDSIDGPSAATVAKSGDAANLKLNLSNQGVVPASDGLAEADRLLLQTPLQDLSTPAQMAAWGAAQARAKNLPAALTALEAAYKEDPSDASIRQNLVTVYTALGRRADADRLTSETEVSEASMLNALYRDKPEGFTKAIQIGEVLAGRSGADKNAKLHMWLACAYAQKYGFMAQANPSDPSLADLRVRVLLEVRKAINADPATRYLLHSFWKPNGDPDDDLSVFGPDDLDLKALLEPAMSGSTVSDISTGAPTTTQDMAPPNSPQTDAPKETHPTDPAPKDPPSSG